VTDISAMDGERAGLECLPEARQVVPELRGIILASNDDRHEIDTALQAGAVTYVVKGAHPDDFASALRQAFAIPCTSRIRTGTGRGRSRTETSPPTTPI
jgi:DNA-binding NarL/FixJ family response regulator